ncbi:hypothetical protein ABIC28_004332 [Rhodococcus sp. PvR044]
MAKILGRPSAFEGNPGNKLWLSPRDGPETFGRTTSWA